MDDSERILEKKALRNVRGLFERLDRSDELQRKRQKYVVLVALVPITLFMAFVLAGLNTPRPDPARDQSRACALDAWNLRAAEYERGMREAHPEMAYRDIQKSLERERPLMMAAAKVGCEPAPMKK